MITARIDWAAEIKSKYSNFLVCIFSRFLHKNIHTHTHVHTMISMTTTTTAIKGIVTIENFVRVPFSSSSSSTYSAHPHSPLPPNTPHFLRHKSITFLSDHPRRYFMEISPSPSHHKPT